jgi:Polyketide cyclase / dehydrase and lipid transport
VHKCEKAGTDQGCGDADQSTQQDQPKLCGSRWLVLGVVATAGTYRERHLGHSGQRLRGKLRFAGVRAGHTVRVAAAPQRVWEVLADVENWPSWTPSVTSITRLDGGPLRIGSKVKIK